MLSGDTPAIRGGHTAHIWGLLRGKKTKGPQKATGPTQQPVECRGLRTGCWGDVGLK